MKNGFRIYDAHTHIGNALHSGRTFSADQLLRAMDEYGVEKSLVIPYPVVVDYRHEHALIGAGVHEYGDRLVGAACLSPFLPREEFQDEIRRCKEQYGFRVLKLQPQYHGLNPISSGSDFYFEAAVEHDLTVVCHTGSGLPFSAPSLYICPAMKFPSLRIVIGHAGGGIFVHEAIVAAKVCPNITVELSTLMPHQVTEVLRHVEADRLMIGSDLPESLTTEFGKILDLAIPAEQKQQILYGTASRVFG
jgi:predicted TIM-barrel fold metal-dependent hydrolase